MASEQLVVHSITSHFLFQFQNVLGIFQNVLVLERNSQRIWNVPTASWHGDLIVVLHLAMDAGNFALVQHGLIHFDKSVPSCSKESFIKLSGKTRSYLFTYHLDEDLTAKLYFPEAKEAQEELIRRRPEFETICGSFVANRDSLVFAVWQLEVCPETRRPHFQGYVEYKNPVRMGFVKAHFGGDRLHVEARRGSRESAVTYCTKEDTRIAGPWDVGSLPSKSQGKRTDLHDVADALLEGRSLSAVAESYPVSFIKYHRGIQSLHGIRARNRREWRTLTVDVFIGESGAGKTRRAISEHSESYFILDQGERVWFDGYDGELALIIDDFYGWIKYGKLLRILDGHPFRCEIKGSFTWAAWTHVIVTSNDHPRTWYDRGLTPALRRRITKVTRFRLVDGQLFTSLVDLDE